MTRVLLVLLLLTAACGGSSGTGSPTPPVPAPVPVTGRVFDAAGRPVVGVLVSATGPAAVPDIAVLTDAEGRYRWPALLAPGRWTLRADTADGPAGATVVLGDSPPGATADLYTPPR